MGWLPGGITGWQLIVALTFVLSACGPRPRIPTLVDALAGVTLAPDSVAALARSLAPTLYLHADETFPLERVVAIKHPTRRILAYHLLWGDDVHGAWVPFTTPTDQEIVWVGYDEDGDPTRLWTYWHGTVVGTDWVDKGPPAVDVQWGKHGLLPRGTLEEDLPWIRQPWLYYAFTWFLPDLALGVLNRDGPLCFCRGFGAYDEHTDPLPLAPRLDAVAVARNPDPVLRALFGEPYSEKIPWPWGEGDPPSTLPAAVDSSTVTGRFVP